MFTITDEDRSMLRTVAGWTRGEAPRMSLEQIRACELLEGKGLLSPVGAGFYGWPWRLTDAGRAAIP